MYYLNVIICHIYFLLILTKRVQYGGQLDVTLVDFLCSPQSKVYSTKFIRTETRNYFGMPIADPGYLEYCMKSFWKSTVLLHAISSRSFEHFFRWVWSFGFLRTTAGIPWWPNALPIKNIANGTLLKDYLSHWPLFLKNCGCGCFSWGSRVQFLANSVTNTSYRHLL